jgi:hypothetical protein
MRTLVVSGILLFVIRWIRSKESANGPPIN